MKKLIVILTVISSFYTAQTFANNATPPVVTQSFFASFTGASNASWSAVNNLYKAEFVLNEQRITAYFNEEGKLVASARNITALQLPILLQADLKNRYANYSASNPFEIDNESGVTYYITIENAGKTLQLKSNDFGNWSVYERK